jgi:peroxiredoxin Q/BCP
MGSMPNVGDPAPDFSLPDGDGNTVTLSDQQGSVTILYFYPKDDTPGCTKEACSFRDVNEDIQAYGAQIFGISADDAASHQAFTEKYNLNFPLLADVDKEVVQDYGVWTERTRGDRTFMGIDRVTFGIDEEGNVARIWKVSEAETHGQEVLEWLRDRS